MTKVSAKPAKADKKDWTKYMDELKKETVSASLKIWCPDFLSRTETSPQ